MGKTPIERIEDSKHTRSVVKTGTKSFEYMLSDYEYEHPRKGQFLEGEIVRIEEEAIFIDVGAKHDAVVSRNDINNLDEELLANLERGDQLPVYVIQAPGEEDNLLVSISKGLEQEYWDRAERCFTSGETLSLEAVGLNRGGLVVSFGSINGFIPNSHIPEILNIRSQEQVEARKVDLIGKQLPLKVIEVGRDRNRLILSAKIARRDILLRRLRELNPGDVTKGVVVNIVNFGVFVDLNGITGLIHISELSWYNVKHPAEELSSGEEIEVMVIEVDHDRERVSLSRKALMPNPWDSVEERYSEGDLVEGVVTSIKNFGVFVRLSTGLEGLIHVSEMHGKPESTLSLGQTVLVRIVAIDPHRERISLSLKRVTAEEYLSWLMHNDPSEGNIVGSPVDENSF
jgi:small subunit ribosomal protein S1